MFVTLEVSKLSGWLNANAPCRDSKEGQAVRGEVYGSGGSRRWTTAAHAACRDCTLGACGTRAERTLNMLPMFVTLEVSKLSGWLNAYAYCRESKEGHAVRGAVYGSGGSRRWTTAVQAACRGGRGCRLGAGHGEERTWNMSCMVVTLEVSKFSGWLNANACCRELKGGHKMLGKVRAGRRGRRCPECSEGSTADWGHRTGVKRTRNIPSMVVTLEVFQLDMSALKFVES
eukprot:scaffold18408_cov61-Phaeocystis_antarctica.AAC.5